MGISKRISASFNTECIAGIQVKAVPVFAEWPTFFSWLQMAIYLSDIQLLSSNVNFY